MEPEQFYGDLGRRLREARKKASLSQATLAARAGIGRAALVAIERGNQRMAVHQLVALAAEVGVEPAMLLPKPGNLPERVGQAVQEAGLPPEVAAWAAEAAEHMEHDEGGDHETG
jgi:transcriptional regulator with XRE-family HTH domain